MMKRNDRLILIYAALGPLFGALTFIVPAAVVFGFVKPSVRAELIIDHWPPIVILSYVFGIIPGFVSAFVTIFATRWLPSRFWRLVAAPVIGGLVSALLIGLTSTLQNDVPMGSGSDLYWLGYLLLFATGAVAAFLCMAIVEILHPLPIKALA